MKKDSLPRVTCRVLFTYSPVQEDELELNINDIIECSGEAEDGWWKGNLNGKFGVFPSNFVEVIHQKEEQQVADKNKRNKELHPPNQAISGLGNILNQNQEIEVPSGRGDSSIPRLPPKPVKEQCVVQFPYEAQNEDELTLGEGRVVNIISKDSEDKGWWRGELDGKIGVFPDNFVKLVNLQEISSGNKKNRTHSPNRDSGNFEKGSKEKISNNLNHHLNHHQHTESTKSSPTKKGSFSKSKTPAKPKAPCPTKISYSSSNSKPVSSAVNIGQPSKGGFLSSFKPSLSKNSSNRSSFSNSNSSNNKSVLGMMSSSPEPDSTQAKSLSKSLPTNVDESFDPSSSSHMLPDGQKSGKDFDEVERSEKLAHPTADRVKGPKRRPPSSIFTKDMIALEDGTSTIDSSTTTNSIEINNSNSTVKENKDVQEKEDPSSEPILRNNDDFLYNNNNNNTITSPNSKSSSPVHAFKEELQNRLESNNENDVSQAKKPDWLEELSRKQANRKSGFFNDKVPGSRSSAPIILDKPQLPTKPSQIRDDIRKLNKRATNIEASGGSDKENSKPNRPSCIEDSFLNSETNNIIAHQSSVVPVEKYSRISDESLKKNQLKKHSYSEPNKKLSKSSDDYENEGTNENLVERVRNLESALAFMESSYSERLNALEASLREEKILRLKLQDELDYLRQ
ncbi:uncharacterized protein cindr [Lepeophtheirus salmonis]|uniref:uncharacterized protein cindr n=1 Tax=Lepeophtheirus salmonis TaxID=72036 RepID=UPI001AE87AED|nr:CD2-associated protein-like [Lepeophtheirus salmonis]XP_040576072.1 CD2-associated protein-like [Lepeophtheirus salmonis]XP_040576073.1 CD2-associated protein-like [Lepeophtheirus salmonis]XP_040576075.1 CD2-associated protein-like [Lepeophtheirus salmonis]XP_040576076.1 CD2-associated protein-like [Lepeophtheirus salmonis]